MMFVKHTKFCYNKFMFSPKTARKPAPMPFRRSLFWDVDPKTIDPIV
jgi:hypothetical protein